MKLQLRGAWATIVEAAPGEFRVLEAWLSTLGRACDRRFLVGPCFPAGFVPQLVAAWGQEQVEVAHDAAQTLAALADECSTVEVVTNSGATMHRDARSTPITEGLYEDQRRDLAVLLEHRRGIAALATGAGKTHLAAALIEQFPTVPWLFLSHRAALIAQAAKKFRGLGLAVRGAHDDARDVRDDASALASAEAAWLTGAGTVALTFDRLRALAPSAAEGILAGAGGLIVDEVHGARPYADVLERCAASIRIGLSATPFGRSDGHDPVTVALFGPVLACSRISDLVAAGRLSPGLVRMLPAPPLAPGAEGDYAAVYEQLITRNEARTGAVVMAALEQPSPRIFLVRTLEHGVRVQEQLRKRDAPVEFVSGDDPSHVRDHVFDLVRQGRLPNLIATEIGEAGVDIPALGTVAVLAAGKSAIRDVQRAGRGVRVAPGKHGVTILDVADVGHAYLEEHARLRAADYAAAGYFVDAPETFLEAAPERAASAAWVIYERGPGAPPAARNARPVATGDWVSNFFWWCTLAGVVVTVIGSCVER